MKKVLIIALAAAVPFLMGSCISFTAVTHSKTFDKALNKEESAVIVFGDGIQVKAYNGIDIFEDWYGRSAWSDERVKATLPAGESEFGFDLNYVSGNTIYRSKNLTLRYYLEPQKKYSVFFTYSRSEKSWGLALYDNVPIPVLRWKRGDVIKFWPMDF